LDAADPQSVRALFETLRQSWGVLHVLVHAIASARREELGGAFSQTSLEGYLLAQNVSAYSLIAMTREARDLLAKEGGSVITLSYIGAARASMHYNVMGSAKAALEANVRYLAAELGPENIRVNAVSAGPIRTLSASGIKDFLDILHNAAGRAPLQRNVEPEEVAHAVSFLASSLSSGITGQVIYVDGGYSIAG
jgi:enoyl-[acyl-carrier protein] reductase I